MTDDPLTQKLKIKAYFSMLYSGHITLQKAQELIGFIEEGTDGWMHGGHRDFNGGKLCYECAEELIGPGAGEVNDLRTAKGLREAFCDWCGHGAFNKNGQRVSYVLLISSS
jgi:hypothetical protein